MLSCLLYGEEFMKKNLLYEYTEILAGVRKRFGKQVFGTTKEEKRENTLYLFSFVFRDTLGISTLSEALENLDMIKKYKLNTLVTNGKVFLRAHNKEGCVTVTSSQFILWCIYNDIDPDKDIIACYEYLISECKNRSNEKNRVYIKEKELFESEMHQKDKNI